MSDLITPELTKLFYEKYPDRVGRYSSPGFDLFLCIFAEGYAAGPQSDELRELVEAAKNVDFMRHADNATGNSFVPDRTDKAIDALVKALAKHKPNQQEVK